MNAAPPVSSCWERPKTEQLSCRGFAIQAQMSASHKRTQIVTPLHPQLKTSVRVERSKVPRGADPGHKTRNMTCPVPYLFKSFFLHSPDRSLCRVLSKS
eukprot:2508761-Amphidinium_carterae.1